ncbi:MAG TPA: polymer-forming cytoskeletal protein [Verrucomicrobiae bacterium]|jgi:cytoskeletal protein CcmA (bactofilin family)
MNPAKVTVTCPHCGNGQPEVPDAYSTVCRKCGQHFRIQEALHPAAKRTQARHDTKEVICFQCGTVLHVAPEAESTMCKRCSNHVDLRDYRIDHAVSKNFRTHGAFVIEEKGYVFNTEVDAGDAVIKGRFLGKIIARRSLTIYSSADFRGTFQAAQLVIPAGNHFRWPTPLHLGGADLAGELAATIQADDTVHVRSTGRLFGDVVTKNLVVEAGAVVVGAMRVGAMHLDTHPQTSA